MDRLMQVPLRWVPDPDRVPVLVAEHDGRRFELRLNVEFPDVPLYTLRLGEDEYLDLEDS